MHGVEVQLVQHQGPVVLARIEAAHLQAELLGDDLHTPVEHLCIEVEAEDRVTAGRSHEQTPFPDCDSMALLEIGIPPGADAAEVRGVGIHGVAGSDVDDVAVEGDATQPPARAVGCAPGSGVAALKDQARLARIEVDQVGTALALAGLAAAHDRSR